MRMSLDQQQQNWTNSMLLMMNSEMNDEKENVMGKNLVATRINRIEVVCIC